MACRQLLEPATRTNQRKARQVHAGDEQHDEDTAPEQRQRGSDVADDIVLKPGDSGGVADVDSVLFQGARAVEQRGVEVFSRASPAAP